MIDFNKRKYIMFDLDGTVIHSQPGIYNALRYTMNKLGFKIPEETILRQFIGPSIGAKFKQLYGITQEQADNVIDIYREYYSTKGLFECEVYDGMKELLQHLRFQGKKIGLATKKPKDYALQIIERVGLSNLFNVIEGSDLDDKSEYKGYVLKKVIKKFGSPDLTQIVMVGDSRYDCIAAKIANVDCIGELYGYGQKQNMIDHGAALIVTDMAELTRTLCGEEI